MYTTDPIELGKRLEQVWLDQQAKNNLQAKSKRSFAISIGADASYFNRAIDGKGFSEDYILEVIRKYGVNEEWLRFGRGDMYGQLSPQNVSQETMPAIKNKTIESLAESTAKLSESNLINARNIDRLITMLEKQSNSLPPVAADVQEIHSAKIYAIEEYLLSIGQQIYGTDRKTESVALGKLEGEGFRLGEGIYSPPNENEDTKHSQERKEKGSSVDS